MYPIILPPAMVKQSGRLGCLVLVWQPVKLYSNIDLASQSARAEGLGKYTHEGPRYKLNLV